MKAYIVAFDDEDFNPWIKIFHSTSLEDVEDQIIGYILDLYEIELKMPKDYKSFKEKCKSIDIFIGEIKELEEYV